MQFLKCFAGLFSNIRTGNKLKGRQKLQDSKMSSLISRQLTNLTLTSKRVLIHFQNNLYSKAIHEFHFDFKSTWDQPWLKKKTNSRDTFSKQPLFQGNSWILPWLQVNLRSTLIENNKQLWPIFKTIIISGQFTNFTLISSQLEINLD